MVADPIPRQIKFPVSIHFQSDPILSTGSSDEFLAFPPGCDAFSPLFFAQSLGLNRFFALSLVFFYGERKQRD